MLRDQFFVADAVLHRADRAVLVKAASGAANGGLGMDGLGGDDAVVAERQFGGVAGGVLQVHVQIGRAGKPQPVLRMASTCGSEASKA